MATRYYYDKRIRNAPIRRRLDRRFVTWVLISACVGAVIASGFVYSARCHFEAVSLGYETQRRRAEIEQHAEQRRQLELERARVLAPDDLTERARRIGLRDPEPTRAEAPEPRAEPSRRVAP
jgi:hypothetical protein